MVSVPYFQEPASRDMDCDAIGDNDLRAREPGVLCGRLQNGDGRQPSCCRGKFTSKWVPNPSHPNASRQRQCQRFVKLKWFVT